MSYFNIKESRATSNFGLSPDLSSSFVKKSPFSITEAWRSQKFEYKEGMLLHLPGNIWLSLILRGPFHQNFSAKCKCAGVQQKMYFNFIDKNSAQLFDCTQLEFTTNFYAFMLYALCKKSSVIPPAQDWHVKCCWNYPWSRIQWRIC